MSALLCLSNAIDRMLIAIARLAAFALLGLIAVTVLDVLSRRFFSMGSTQLQEAEWHLHTIVIMVFISTTFLYDRHVRIDLASSFFSPRLRAMVEIAGILLLVLPFCAVTGYYATNFAYTSFIRNEVSQSVDGLPFRWAIKSMLPLGIYLLALAGVSRMFRAVVALKDPERADLGAASKERL